MINKTKKKDYGEKKRDNYLQKKELIDTFLKYGAFSQA